MRILCQIESPFLKYKHLTGFSKYLSLTPNSSVLYWLDIILWSAYSNLIEENIHNRAIGKRGWRKNYYASANVLMRKLESCQPCLFYFDTLHLPKIWCIPWTFILLAIILSCSLMAVVSYRRLKANEPSLEAKTVLTPIKHQLLYNLRFWLGLQICQISILLHMTGM